MPQYTAIFKHTCPTFTWAEADPHYAHPSYGMAAQEKFYGKQAGEFLDHQMFLQIIHAADAADARRLVEAGAATGWGTVIFALFEGALLPIIQSDLLIPLSPAFPQEPLTESSV